MPPRVKLVVLATGDLAIPVLDAVVDAGHETLRIVAHSPKSGSDGFPPEERLSAALGRWARRHEIQLSRRSHPGSDPVRQEVEALAPDLGLIVAYGRRFPTSLLEIPRRGWLKVHFSLLPKYRGSHPIRAALWHGDTQTGVSVIRVSEEPDAGPIVEQQSLQIEPGETFGELAPRVAALATGLVGPAIARVIRSKSPKVRKQNEKSASATPRFGRRHRTASWWRAAREVSDRLRALSPEPGMTTLVKGERVRILQGAPADYIDSPIAEAGSFIGLRSGRIAVLCGDGKAFAFSRVRRSNGETVAASTFAREKRLQVGDVLV
jgi:methionyl-tRNA formyltransferase